MKSRSIHICLVVLLIAATALIVPAAAEAAGTTAGTPINNRATVNYSVGGVAQTQINSAPTGSGGNSTPGAGGGSDTSFVVDDKVMMSIADNSGSAITTYPSSTNSNAMTFSVTNNGNYQHDIALVTALTSNTMVGGTPSVDLYEDTNGNGTYDQGTDLIAGAGGAVYLKTSATGTVYIDELASDATRTVFLVITTPAGAGNGEQADFSLTATAHNDLAQVRAGGTAGSLGNVTAANSGTADDPAQIDIVLADGAGDGDAGSDGMFTRNGANGFTVQAMVLNVTKSAAVLSDGFSGSNFKAIPGAVVEYTIRVTYSGGSGNATGVSLSDAVPANTTAQENVYGSGEVELTTFIGAGPAAVTNVDGASLANWGTAAGSAIEANCGAVTLGANGDYCQIRYQVTIN